MKAAEDNPAIDKKRRISPEYSMRVTVLDKKLYPELQAQYCAVPETAGCALPESCTAARRAFPSARKSGMPSADTSMPGCRGAMMHGWRNDDRGMIGCCNDGARPVIFRIEHIDIP